MSIEAGIGIELDLGDRIQAMHDDVRKMMKIPLPTHRTIGASFNGTAAVPPSPLLLAPEITPAAGRVWELYSWGVYGNDGHTTVASVVCDLYCGNSIDPNIVDFSALKDSGLTVGTTRIDGHKKVWVEPQQQVYVLAYSMPASQNLTFIVQVNEWWLEDVEALIL